MIIHVQKGKKLLRLKLPPENGKFAEEAKRLIEELKEHGIDLEIFEIVYSSDPNTIPSITFIHNSYVWEFVGYNEIRELIKYWKDIVETKHPTIK
jgi:hypothetical protein